MNNINCVLKNQIDKLDKDIINLISIRKTYKTNSSIYKNPILSNINIPDIKNNNMSLLDYNI